MHSRRLLRSSSDACSGHCVVYHEHDTPDFSGALSMQMRLVAKCRSWLCRNAELLVMPQEMRLQRVLREEARALTSICVWNCPPRAEARGRPEPGSRPLRLYYHGTLNEERVPNLLLEALSHVRGQWELHLLGYETIGSVGFVKDFMTRAGRLGSPSESGIWAPLRIARRCSAMREKADLGLALASGAGQDVNLRFLSGASNKVFEYMACGTRRAGARWR